LASSPTPETHVREACACAGPAEENIKVSIAKTAANGPIGKFMSSPLLLKQSPVSDCGGDA